MQFAHLIHPTLLKYFPLVLAALVLFIYSVFVYFIYHLEAEQTYLENVYFFNGTISIFMVFWTLFKTCTTNPGFVPKNTLQDNEKDNPRKVCRSCRIKRPERSHHCSKCKNCVLNMDHHCLWTANCIGFYNRKYFNLILLWGSMGMLNASFLGLSNFMTIYNRFMEDNDAFSSFTQVRRFFVMFMIASQFFNGAGLYYFTWQNLKLILYNISTLDEMVLDHRSQLKAEEYEHLLLYNLGPKYNFQFYFGDNPILWFLPIGKPLGDGYYWDKQTNQKDDLAEDGIQLV